MIDSAIEVNYCEHIIDCSFFTCYCQNNEQIVNGWSSLFCKDKNKSETCARKLFFKKHNVRPPENLSPLGMELPL